MRLERYSGGPESACESRCSHHAHAAGGGVHLWSPSSMPTAKGRLPSSTAHGTGASARALVPAGPAGPTRTWHLPGGMRERKCCLPGRDDRSDPGRAQEVTPFPGPPARPALPCHARSLREQLVLQRHRARNWARPAEHRDGGRSPPRHHRSRTHRVHGIARLQDRQAHPQQPSGTGPESSWRWRESNPRPRTTGWVFYGRSRRIDLASGLPPAEDPSAIPASMSGGGHQAEPPSSACSRRPTRGRRRPAADGRLVPRQRVPAQSWQLFHPGF
jgi:hypothetical protein